MPHKKCIIVHGCPADSGDTNFNKHWIPWLTENLRAHDFVVEIPLMPTPWQPDYEKVKAEFEKYTVNENTILVGHSCGCAFLVRWLGETQTKIAKLILVAPWKIAETETASEQEFYNYPIDTSIADKIGKIVMFTADDEDADGKTSLKLFHEALGGEIIELSGHGHYTLGDMGTEAFPELLDNILQ
jgi:hypothetical protein